MGHIPHWRKQFKSINTYGLREGKTHYLFYKNIIVLHLNKLESPLPKDALWQFGWYWPSGSGDESFLISSIISLLSPLGKEQGPSFEQTSIPFTQGCFVPSLIEIGPVVFEKKVEIGKVYRWTDRRTDRRRNRRSEKHMLAFSSGELKKQIKSTTKELTMGHPINLLNYFLMRNAEKRYTGIWSLNSQWFL